ncbi:hypothetical protein [Luteimonas terrae]|uniref:Uncharacterized protein n=1 Tax=Luteimonas terrae TaxID=1530191 RepID=A0ABU1XXR1_9GAMM|nr:hypothetical protein [Luteimonas terrae]MDR7193555.1 hypothetical protein [Luteimonas terrae]
MRIEDILLVVAGDLPVRLPVLIALVVGLALVAQRRSLPTASRTLGLIGFGVLLLMQLLSMFAFPMLQMYIISAAMPTEQMQMMFTLMTVPLALLHATGLVLLALAIVRSAR